MLNFSFLLSTYLPAKGFIIKTQTLRFSSEGMWPIKTCLAFYGIRNTGPLQYNHREFPGTENGFIINQPDAPISQIYFGRKLYMFRTVPLSIIRNFFFSCTHSNGIRRTDFPDSLQAISGWNRNVSPRLSTAPALQAKYDADF